MQELTRIRLRTLLWLILPVTVVVVIPLWIYHRFEGPWCWDGNLRQWIGVWLIANGAGLAAWCANLFNVVGRGTPLPFDPPKCFVVSGPYRYVRNPMMLGMLLILLGETVLSGAWRLGMYAVVIAILAHLFVRYWEEPDLRRRFGPAYKAYCAQVLRWIPRRAPWSGTTSHTRF